ncbi:MAG: hypothetical protein FWC70_03910 [Defluviitaleaceae bacterium]|nr:hypothetical protein [Defluviitaleaceae bacterium]
MRAIYFNMASSVVVGQQVNRGEVIGHMLPHMDRYVLELILHTSENAEPVGTGNSRRVNPAPFFDLSGIMDDLDFLSRPMANFFTRNADASGIHATDDDTQFAENTGLAVGDEVYLYRFLTTLYFSHGGTSHDMFVEWNDDGTVLMDLFGEVHLLIPSDMSEEEALYNHYQRTTGFAAFADAVFDDADFTDAIDDYYGTDFFESPIPREAMNIQPISGSIDNPYIVLGVQVRQMSDRVAISMTQICPDVSVTDVADNLRFSSQDDVAIAFAERFNRRSIHEGRELGAAIFRVDVFATRQEPIIIPIGNPFITFTYIELPFWPRTVRDENILLETFYSFGVVPARRGMDGVGMIFPGPIAHERNNFTLSINPSDPPNAPNVATIHTEVAQVHSHGPNINVEFFHWPSGGDRAQRSIPGISIEDRIVAIERGVDTYVVDICGSLFKATVAARHTDEQVIATGFYECPLRQFQRGRAFDLRVNPYLWPWHLRNRTPDFCLYAFIDTLPGWDD